MECYNWIKFENEICNIEILSRMSETLVELVRSVEHELEAILLSIRIPMRPIPVSCVIRLVFYFTSGDMESDCLVWFRSDLTSTQ
jgi:hypothetical protein